jgi:hypothetical protein
VSSCQLIFLTTDHYLLTTALVGLGRVELPTSPLSGVRSSQLSYRPVQLSVASIQLPVNLF